MRELLKQIEAGLESGLYYLSLIASLILPDIYGAIDSSSGTASRKKYTDWFNKYVAPAYSTHLGQFLTGEDCYRFRCSLLHQGSSQHRQSTYARYIFVEPSATNVFMHCNIINDALNLDLKTFCKDVIAGTEKWLAEVEGTERYQANYSRFMRRYPSGLPPYMGGIPVIS